MKWTRNTPNGGGWYWYRASASASPETVLLEVVISMRWEAAHIYVWRIGIDSHYDADTLTATADCACWAGPIPIPEEE